MRSCLLNGSFGLVLVTAVLLVATGCGSDDGDSGGGAGDDGASGQQSAAGSSGAEPTAGAAGEETAGAAAEGAGTGAGATSAGCDTSSFLTDCTQGGQYWGTEQQSGPCSAGTTVYGVTRELGPYGARSKYNVGEAFNTGNTSADFLICPVFIDSFGADPIGSADLKDTHDLDFGLFTVFYPGCMPDGEKFPLITWGNGTCAMPEGYGPLLRHVASHGYIIVAPNSVQVGMGTQQVKGIDFMLAENDDPNSEFYQKIDTDKIGAMGHSQGGMGTVYAADDPRVKAVILFNGGTAASKPFLIVSGDADLGGTPSSSDNAVQAAQVPAAWLWYHQIPNDVNGSTTGPLAPGHLTLMMESERVNDVAVAWWDMMLKGTDEAGQMFLGDDCTLCDGTAFPSMWAPQSGVVSRSVMEPSIEYGHNAMLE